MAKTITRLFDDYSDAAAAVSDLKSLGVPESDISFVANNANKQHGDHEESREDAGRGAIGGTVLGGAGGLLAGLGLLAIPGLGPVVAAGWLVATAVGAGIGAAAGGIGGGIVGALLESGVSADDAQVYSEGVRRGGTLVSARVADDKAAAAERILDDHKSVSAATRGPEYRASGWLPAAHPTDAELVDKREPMAGI